MLPICRLDLLAARTWSFAWPLLLALCTGSGARVARGEDAPAGPCGSASSGIVEAVVCGERLICLGADGAFRVWSLPDGRFDAEAAAAMAHEGATHLVCAGGQPWATDATSLLRWSDAARAWKRDVGLGTHPARLQLLAVVDDAPVLVFRDKIARRSAEARLERRRLDGRRRIDADRVLVWHATPGLLHLGVGYGEWGGEVADVQPSTGRSRGWSDEGGYPTGIAQARDGELTVAWSMSHMGLASSRIRVHELDGRVVREGPDLDGHYLQRLTWSAFDAALYAVDDQQLVRIDGDAVRSLAPLAGCIYRAESLAVGVRPGIVLLQPIGPGQLVIVPSAGAPWILEAGHLRLLPGAAASAAQGGAATPGRELVNVTVPRCPP